MSHASPPTPFRTASAETIAAAQAILESAGDEATRAVAAATAG